MRKIAKKIKQFFPLSWRDLVILLVVLASGSGICMLLQTVSTSDVHVPMIFVLMVLIISLLTDGYFYGILAAFASVFAVNWAFTYPYMKLDFSIYGYPLTFITMLAVGLASSTLASRLKEQQKLRLEAEREKTRANLLRSVSHDLRTPLTAISGSVTAILEDDGSMPESEKTELLSNAKQDAEWLSRMVENLLSVTRFSGSTSITKEEELLEEVLGEAVSTFKKRCPDIAVDISVPDDALFIPMDATLIEQVLLNLMDNAVSHGETTSRISVLAIDEGNYVSISVKDNGRGIDPRILPHLFDSSASVPIHRTADSSRHMGIGLTLCRTIIEAHDGYITASNSPEGGAQFLFTLKKGDSNDNT